MTDMRASDAEIRFLDREYNPRTQIPEFAAIFSRWKGSAQQARESLRARLDVRYGPGTAETLDFFPAPTTGSPLLIFLHGGYWRALDKSDFSWIASVYVASGISVAIVNYGLAPATELGEIVRQARRACGWLYVNAPALGVDPDRIVCTGHSAGGHLTAMMLATDWTTLSPRLPQRLLAGAVAISGLFDLAPLTRAEFLRHDLHLDVERARDLSPIYLTWHNDVPLLRAVGACESSEFQRQSILIGRHWPRACEREIIRVPGCHHLSVCEALGTADSLLFQATCSLLS